MTPAAHSARPNEAADDPIDVVARALADRTRRGLLRLLRDDEWAAGDLAAQFPEISRPAVSQHLRVLHDAGLVDARRDGNRRMYSARTEGLAEVWQFVDEMWSDRLARLKRAAERAARDAPASRKRAKPR